MRTLAELSDLSQNWQDATHNPLETEWLSFPYLGKPWEHDCMSLRSKAVTTSIIVPFWNSAGSIGECLNAIRLSSLNRLAPHRLEVILCDDGSSDESWETAKTSARGLNVQAFRLPHRSQSLALNFALEHASGDVVIFCDSDMVLSCGALDELLARHEKWSDAVCFGFRSNFESSEIHPPPDAIWSLMHMEAFSQDNRVFFDLPTIEPNMLVATRWLAALYGGRAIIDSQGSLWPRHRFLYGCLFSARLGLLHECEFFPDTLGWGYGDTLLAARLEASGGFLLPVTSAWGHHIQHGIRHPDQWFQGSRNRLAYEYLLSCPATDIPWRTLRLQAPVKSFIKTANHDTAGLRPAPRAVGHSATTLARLGLWKDCLTTLDSATPEGNLLLRAECLFRLEKYEDIARNGSLYQTIWGVLSLKRCGSTTQAIAALRKAEHLDPTCAFAGTASVPELRMIATHYASIGMLDVANNYNDLAALANER